MFQTYLGQTMSWGLVSTGLWQIKMFIESQEMAYVVNACAMSALAILLVLVLDKAADWLNKKAAQAAKCAPQGASPQEGEESGDEDPEFEKIMHGTFAKLQDAQHHADTIRVIILCLGLLVGIVWEKAFDAADEALLKYHEVTREHIVITKILMAAVIIGCLTPAWVQYIVPKARMSHKDAEALILSERVNHVRRLLDVGNVEEADGLLQCKKHGKHLRDAIGEEFEAVERCHSHCRMITTATTQDLSVLAQASDS